MIPNFAQSQYTLVAESEKPSGDWNSALGIIAAAIASSIVTVIVGFNKYISAWFSRLTKAAERGRQDYAIGTRKVAAVYTAIEQMGKLEGVDRIVVFTGTNCGGVPDPKKPYTVRPLYRWSTGTNDATGRSPEDVYNSELRVDSHYMKTICDVIEKGWVIIKTADLPHDAMMKRYLNRECVFQSRLYRLHIDSIQLTWLSIASYKRDFSDDELEDIDIVVDRIRALMDTDE